MKVSLIDNISKTELVQIKNMIGEAFITNELFHEFGDINERKELVLKYMNVYTDYVYESKALYGTENRKAIVGFIHGCKLYNQALASNGVSRYNLVWTGDD